jgi:hypothetical protein
MTLPFIGDLTIATSPRRLRNNQTGLSKARIWRGFPQRLNWK